MELRHQHRNDRELVGEEKTRRDRELERPRWPGKRTKTQGAEYAEIDARTPDLRRIRAALGSLRSGGQALPGEMTAQYSQLLGLDLSDVRIHRGQAAKSLEATAFTAGTNIAVAEHLDLDSAFGRHVIAHELVHVAQNKRSGAPMDLAAHMEIGPSGSAVEQEAERGAAALTRGESFTVQAHGRLPGISRFGDDETPPPGAGSAPTTLSNTSPAPVKPDNTPTPTTQPTTAAPAPPPATPAPPANAAPTAQPRPSDQPANTPQAPATPAVGTPGHNQPSGSAPATNPTTLPNKEPRPTATPQAPAPAGTLDARVQQELETRADPTLKAGYARAVGGVDSLRIQALQYSFTPNGVWNTLVETFTAKNAFQDHFGQIYSTNAYRGGKSWADTAQAWIEGLRGVVHIIGDVASVVSAWAGMAALVTGALALILSETVIGGIALGAIAAIAAEIAMVAGAIKLLTDIIDMLLGIIQMIILIVRARNSKDPGERAKFAALLHKEANDFGANVVSIGVQVAVMAVSAGIGAGMSRGANSFMSAFKDEFSKMITPALKPWTLGNNFRNIAKMMAPVAPGSGVAARGNNLLGQQTGRTVLQVEVDQGLVGINRNLRVGSRITRAREVVPFTTRNQMNGARLVTMRQAVSRAMTVNTAGVKIGLGSSQLQADIKQPRASGGGTSGSSPAGTGGRIDAASKPAGADLSKVQMWPSQIEAFQNAKGPLSGAVDRTQRQYDMAESQAGPELSAQVRQAMQGATNNAGQMRFGATQVQTDAREGQANSQRGITQATQANDQKTRMGATQNTANASVQRIQGQGGKLQSPPPKEGVLGWLYNQTIGRIGGWIGSAQKWVMNLVGKWAMSLAGFSKEEMDIAGIENDMRADDKKDATSTQEAQDAALKADQVQQTVFQLQENKTRDEQYAIQAMADAQRFIASLEDADKQLGAAITNGQSYIAAVTPVIAHEMQTEQAGSAIDAQYVAPLVAYATAFGDSIDGSNIGSSANTDGTAALSQMKAAYPELDIGPGTSAIGTAVSQYDTAFGQLAGQARGQVAAAQTAIQAFIGTQDYDGASGNAAALDALAADFDRAAQALADQLYAGINGVITQYNGHIQRAIDEANQVPADQVDPAAVPPPPPPPPVDAPATVDDASGFATGYATERTGVAPNPAVMSETKAPVADNAAKPATSDAAMAEKAATPPAEPAAAPEKADASGTKPAPNDGTPAKDDVAKAGAVDAKPKSDAPGAPATAKPIGTPKAQANKADADKTDADKLDVGAAPMSNDAGGDTGSEPSKPQPKTGARAASTKPQETPVEQPITSPVAATAGSSAVDATAKTKQDPNRKGATKSKAGGGLSSSMSTSEHEAEGEQIEESSEESYGVEVQSGEATGDGLPGTPEQIAQPANAGGGSAAVTHQTEVVVDGLSDQRTTVGVGEKILFTADQAGSWTASSSGPGGAATGRNANYDWIAPATAGSSTITFTPTGGTAQTFEMTVVAPSGIDFESPAPKTYPNGTQGVGMITNVRFQPTTVSFYRTKWKEIGGPASGATGYFENRRIKDHEPNLRWLQIGGDNGGPHDDASFYAWSSPWTAGGFEYVIPNRYLVAGESGAGHEFTQVTQACAMENDGTTTITKGGPGGASATTTRAPGTAARRGRTRGRGGGYATGFGGDQGLATGNPGGGGPPPQRTSGGAPLDKLRTAVTARDAKIATKEFKALRSAGKTALKADLALVGNLIVVLDRPGALAVIKDLKLDRKGTLQVASVKFMDGGFLGDVLRHLKIDIAGLPGAAADLAAHPVFAAANVLDPIINAASVTAKQQLALATSAGGSALLQKIYPNQSPLTCLPKLAADLKLVRDGYVKSPDFAHWLMIDAALLHTQITMTLDGGKWARAMWRTDQPVLLGWIAADNAYWGNTFADALIKPEAGDGDALRSMRPLAGKIFDVIGSVRGIDVLVQILSLLKFPLAEQITALEDAHHLDAANLALVLDGPNIDADEQNLMTDDGEAVTLVKRFAFGKRPSQVLTILAGEPDKFTDAVGRPGMFSDWVTADPSVLIAEIKAVTSWNGWVSAFYTLDKAPLLLQVAATVAFQPSLRTALKATSSFNWFFKNVSQPVPDQAQVAVLFALYDETMAVEDKYAMWGALYRAKLRRAGDDHVEPWTDAANAAISFERRYHAISPNDDAMKLFYTQMRMIPRTHVDTATSVLMCDYFTIKKTVAGAGGAAPVVSFVDAQLAPLAAPGQIKLPTSYYFSNHNMIVMRAVNAAFNTPGTTWPARNALPAPGEAPNKDVETDSFVGKVGVGPGSVRKSKPGDPDMNQFQNHVSHEVGHAVGAKKLLRGPYQMTGDQFAEKYGQWKEGGGSQEGYARMLKFSTAMDTTMYLLSDRSSPPKSLPFIGMIIRIFLTGIAEGGLKSQDSSALGTFFGDAAKALAAISNTAALAGNTLFKSVNEQQDGFPYASCVFPHGIEGADKVHMFHGSKWWTYHGDVWRNRVSHYSVSAVGENFAEMYTQKYTNGGVPPKIGSYDPTVFFDNLTAAGPAELGLAPYTDKSKSPGAPDGNDGNTKPGGGSGPPPEPRPWP